MQHILICEDDRPQRTRLEKIIKKHIFLGDYGIDIALSTENPYLVLEYLKTHQSQGGIYFLDIDLQSDINGIELAAKIKGMDVSATIVFITTHSEMVHYVFKLKVEAMDYILKDGLLEEIEERVASCIQTAHQRFLDGKHAKNQYFTIRVGRQKLNILFDDILFFESSANPRNKLLLHRVNGVVTFYGAISDVEKLGPQFCKCHQSYVVNVKRVKRVDIASREVEMMDGSIVPVAKRKLAELLDCMG